MLSRLEISQSDFDELTAFIKEKYGLDLREWDVLLVEDILDTGRTLCELKKKFASMGAPSVKIAVMLDKPSRRVADITPDFKCYEIEDRFVVGCGLDYDERYRNLPFIGIVSE